MSAANRSKASGTGHERHADDAYVTEGRVVRALTGLLRDRIAAWSAALPAEERAIYAPKEGTHPLEKYVVCDAGAGEGAISRELSAGGIGRDGRLYGVEKRPDLADKCLEVVPCVEKDFLAFCKDMEDETVAKAYAVPRPHAVIMNPPYGLSIEFVEAARRLARPTKVKSTGEKRYALVAALLRLSWMGSQKRSTFHTENPSEIFVLGERPSFTADGKTDSSEYAWFVWTEHPAFRMGSWSILPIEHKVRKVRGPKQAAEPPLPTVAEGERSTSLEP